MWRNFFPFKVIYFDFNIKQCKVIKSTFCTGCREKSFWVNRNQGCFTVQCVCIGWSVLRIASSGPNDSFQSISHWSDQSLNTRLRYCLPFLFKSHFELRHCLGCWYSGTNSSFKLVPQVLNRIHVWAYSGPVQGWDIHLFKELSNTTSGVWAGIVMH